MTRHKLPWSHATAVRRSRVASSTMDVAGVAAAMEERVDATPRRPAVSLRDWRPHDGWFPWRRCLSGVPVCMVPLCASPNLIFFFESKSHFWKRRKCAGMRIEPGRRLVYIVNTRRRRSPPARNDEGRRGDDERTMFLFFSEKIKTTRTVGFETSPRSARGIVGSGF